MHDEPIDPFAGDPADPAADLNEESQAAPLSVEERQDVLDELADLEVFEALLAPRGYRGLVIECEDCHEPHYYSWALMRGNLRNLLGSGALRVHEPAFEPDPEQYVTLDYARGYSDGVQQALAEGE